MKFVAAYLLACLGADSAAAAERPTKEDVRRILDSVGADAGEEEEEGSLDLLFARLEGKDVAELVAAGREQLAYAPSGAAAAGVAATAAAGEAKEDKEEEKKEEE